MTSKQITGIVLVALGTGALVYLYKAYYKPIKEVDDEFKKASSISSNS